MGKFQSLQSSNKARFVRLGKIERDEEMKNWNHEEVDNLAIVEEKQDGGLIVSAIVNGQRVKETFYGYSREEAVNLFNTHVKTVSCEICGTIEPKLYNGQCFYCAHK